MIVRNSPFPTSMNSQQSQKIDSVDNKVEEVTQQSQKMPEIDYVEAQNEQKVQNIKKEIDNGTYKIDINKSADKMAQDLLVDLKVYK
ncbi:flagellar biosynthesis anti-sigma factor FlgM [Helicobacter sp. MIT 14-3879]|uniref:flagellar biosynthesis anti-sigma factor FlgM n=1 Tax=Helicobacter sp. MIT 14-3879 TaxID=2040649 RepID=UPI000E1F1576|nr:flagellar biosynthesis anti-sigma factor FlgM [Helicobacter sp. MIT 14-3879]RDU65081.1 hypothetical protein CQA44_01865 [Helicobacter sp. MIT 14-3879]